MAALCAAAGAPGFQVRPPRIVVPFAAGGPLDTSQARIVGSRMTELPGRHIIIDNRAGATGITGAELVAKAPAGFGGPLQVLPGHRNQPGKAPGIFEADVQTPGNIESAIHQRSPLSVPEQPISGRSSGTGSQSSAIPPAAGAPIARFPESWRCAIDSARCRIPIASRSHPRG